MRMRHALRAIWGDLAHGPGCPCPGWIDSRFCLRGEFRREDTFLEKLTVTGGTQQLGLKATFGSARHTHVAWFGWKCSCCWDWVTYQVILLLKEPNKIRPLRPWWEKSRKPDPHFCGSGSGLRDQQCYTVPVQATPLRNYHVRANPEMIYWFRMINATVDVNGTIFIFLRTVADKHRSSKIQSSTYSSRPHPAQKLWSRIARLSQGESGYARLEVDKYCTPPRCKVAAVFI